MADDSYSRRNLLKPSWVTRIEESGNGRGRTKVAATFPRCRCGRDQEQCAVTKKRDRDAATLAVIEQCLAHEERPNHDRGGDAMVDTNDKGTENDKDEEMLEAFSLPKRLETPAAGVGL